jgi:beta-glucanase (GH16 family)
MSNLDLTGYKLTFSDEFNTRSISATGEGTTWADMRSQWVMSDGKAELGFGHSSFVDPSSGYDPFRVEGGALTITAAGDVTPSGWQGGMESGLITTEGNWSQKQGYFEMRADLSDAPHAWDAFWMLPVQQVNPGTPGAWQELDVVEHYGENDKGVYSHIHTTDPQNGVPWQENRHVYSELANKDGYHTYGVLWEDDKLSFYVDGEFKGSQATPSDYSNPQYLIANLATQDGAVGGEQMKIDYIRAYSNDGSNPTVALGEVSPPDGNDPGMYGAMALDGSAAAPVDHTTDVVVADPDPVEVASDTISPAAPAVVADADVPPAAPAVVAADDVPPAAPAVSDADDVTPAAQTNGGNPGAPGRYVADLQLVQTGLSADVWGDFIASSNTPGARAEQWVTKGNAHDIHALIQTLQGGEKNISNFDAARGGLFEARFDNELLGNDSNFGAEVSAMIRGLQTHDTALVTAAAEGFRANAVDVSGNNVPPPGAASGAGNAVAHAAPFGTDNACAHQHQHFEHMWG